MDHQLEIHRDLPESISAPVQAGQQLGSLTVTGGGQTLLEVPLVAAEAVEALSVPELFLSLLGSLCGAK